MKKRLEKRQWMMLSLVAALGVAVYLNYYLTKEPSLAAGTTEEPTSSDADTEPQATLGEASYVGATVSDVPKEETQGNYFDKARASRRSAREESLAILQEILDRVDGTEQEKGDAAKAVEQVAENVLKESDMENRILAKGFPDCVVFLENDRCSVAVQGKDLQEAESAQILEIVLSQSSLSPKNVQITAVEA